jgi:hypothetical protein
MYGEAVAVQPMRAALPTTSAGRFWPWGPLGTAFLPSCWRQDRIAVVCWGDEFDSSQAAIVVKVKNGLYNNLPSICRARAFVKPDIPAASLVVVLPVGLALGSLGHGGSMGAVVTEWKCLERPIAPLPKHRDGTLLSQIGCVALMALPVIAVGLVVLLVLGCAIDGWLGGECTFP